MDKKQKMHKKISKLAYNLYIARGGRGGYDLEDWLVSEKEVIRNSRLFKKAIIILGIILLSFLIVFIIYTMTPKFIGFRQEKLTDFQQKAIDIYIQTINLLITIATFLLGAIWASYHNISIKYKLNLSFFIFLLSSLMVIGSICCGFMAHISLLKQLVAESFYNPYDNQVSYFFDLQLIAFILSLIIFFIGFVQSIFKNED